MTHKNKLPEPAPEPEHRKAAPKKTVKKKVVKNTPTGDIPIEYKVEPKPVSISHTLAPVTVVTTTEEYKAPNIQDLHAEFGVKDIPHQVEEDVKQSATGIWDKTKVLWGKYAWILVVALFITVIIFIWIEANRVKVNKSVKETQQTDQKIEDGKASTRELELKLSHANEYTVDSTVQAKIHDAISAMQFSIDFHHQMILRNEQNSKEHEKSRADIRNANGANLRLLAGDSSK